MLITLRELREKHLRVYAVATIRSWAREGLIPAVRVGHKFMFDPADVLAALKMRTSLVKP